MFVQPHQLDEALELKQQYGTEAAFVAGGTDLIVTMNHGRALSPVLIDLTYLPEMSDITLSRGETSLNGCATWRARDHYVAGGAATFATCATVPVACLAQAALSVGGPQIRNRASIGGNIASASPAGDGSTALLALDAELELRSSRQSRTVPLQSFFQEYRKTCLQPDEMIYRVRFPAEWPSAWFKLGKRGAVNISLVCCAASVAPDGVVRVAFGSVGPYPMRAPKAEQLLTSALRACAANDGSSASVSVLDSSVVREAAELAGSEVQPISDFRGSADYRRAMAGVTLRKVLRSLGARV